MLVNILYVSEIYLFIVVMHVFVFDTSRRSERRRIVGGLDVDAAQRSGAGEKWILADIRNPVGWSRLKYRNCFSSYDIFDVNFILKFRNVDRDYRIRNSPLEQKWESLH